MTATDAAKLLFERKIQRRVDREYVQAGLIAAFCVLAFALFLARSKWHLSGQFDQHWHQAAIDYDINWGTPFFSLAGNILNNFAMQVPLNGNLAPILGLSHVIAPGREIELAVACFFLITFLMLWFLAGWVGLRPIPRVLVAGLSSLIVTVPAGLDKVLYVVPPFLFTNQLILGLWWYEVGLLCLLCAISFLFLGQRPTASANLTLAFCFSFLCALVLLAFSQGAIFTIPVILLYCAAFLVTSTTKTEFYWKLASGGALGLVLVLTGFASFLPNLYSYTFSSYFIHLFPPVPSKQLLLGSSMAGAFLRNDLRACAVMILSIITLIVSIVTGPASLRRFAIAVIVCEIGILSLGAMNALTIRFPISMFYSEVFHEPFLIFFFSLFCVFLFACVDRWLKAWLQGISAIAAVGSPQLLLPFRPLIYWSVAGVALVNYIRVTPPNEGVLYPPAEPPSVQLLKREVGLHEGGPFRGRVLVLPAINAPPGVQWLGGPGSISDVLIGHYRTFLGNDHYMDLLPFDIPITNEHWHWTSPVTFAFLHAFFANKADPINDKSHFPLRVFNLRIARLSGVRLVVTDVEKIPAGVLIYETSAGTTPLRIFRLDGVNVGQYSPVHVMPVTTAVAALERLSQDSFDPERDAVAEEQLSFPLVPATAVEVVVDRGPTLRVRAESAGWSLLALPFEYSACLRLQSMTGDTRLLPVNLQQTGVLFRGRLDARIAYNFGPFDHPQCRHLDKERADKLRLRELVQTNSGLID